MANHRMFSCRIGNMIQMIKLPFESQALYFHLILRADDDGVVELYPVLRLLNIDSDSDALHLLFHRKFILPVGDNYDVCLINAWYEHNKIRSDRKTDSMYIETIRTLYPGRPYVISRPRKDREEPLLIDGPSNGVIGTSHRSRREGKVSKDKVREGDDPLSYLETLPEEEAVAMAKIFNCSKQQVISKAKSLADYCKLKNKIYDDYRAFLSRTLREDFGERQIKPLYKVVDGKAVPV